MAVVRSRVRTLERSCVGVTFVRRDGARFVTVDRLRADGCTAAFFERLAAALFTAERCERAETAFEAEDFLDAAFRCASALATPPRKMASRRRKATERYCVKRLCTNLQISPRRTHAQRVSLHINSRRRRFVTSRTSFVHFCPPEHELRTL